MGEIWRPVRGYEGLYDVSSNGRIRTLNYKRTGTTRVMSNCNGSNGYLHIILYKDGARKQFYVHRVVADAFLPEEDGRTQIDHINGNRADNRLENLRRCSCAENLNFPLARENNSKSQGRPIQQMTPGGEVIKEWRNISFAARSLGIRRSSLSECCNNPERRTAAGYKWTFK